MSGDLRSATRELLDTAQQEWDAARVHSLRSFHVLDTEAEEAFDSLTRLAAQICETPMALVTLVDRDRLWVKSKVGLDVCSADRDTSFCTHALAQPDIFVVPDAALDPRFATNAAVTGEPNIRFYAGVPLIVDDGLALGMFCVLDVVPRVLTSLQIDQLTALAQQVGDQLVLRRQAKELAAEVTSRREVQHALAKTEHRWRSLVERSPVAVAVIGTGGRFHYVNPRAVRLFGGTDASEFDGLAADMLVPAGSDDSTSQLLRGVLTGGEMPNHRWTLRRLDGRSADVELNAAPVEYDGLDAVQIELRDVTEALAAADALRESEALMRGLVDGSPIGIALCDEQGRLVRVNPALCAVLGRTESQLLGAMTADFMHPDDVTSHQRISTLVGRSSGGVLQIETRAIRPDGEVRWILSTVTHTPGGRGEPYLLAHMQDITDRKAAADALVESEAELTAVAAVVKKIQNGADPRQTIVEAARTLANADVVTLMQKVAGAEVLRTTAATAPELLDVEVPLVAVSATGSVFCTGRERFMSDPYRDPVASSSLLKRSEVRSLYIVPVEAGGVVTAVLAVGWNNTVADLDDGRARVVRLLADNTGVGLHQAAMMQQLQQLALTDPLTSLPNRRNWDERLATLLQVSRRTGVPLTVALADLDHFKRYNDVYGHLAGDELLREFALMTRGKLRAGDVVARWGGEEFAFALPNCGPAEAARVLDRVRLAVPRKASASFGLATWNGEETADQLMVRADEALYRAKSGGRNQVLAAV